MSSLGSALKNLFGGILGTISATLSWIFGITAALAQTATNG